MLEKAPTAYDSEAPSQRFSLALTAIRWGPTDFAIQADVSERTVRRWLTGSHEPPEALLAWLERLAEFLRNNPPPMKKRDEHGA